jgi:hypothetical protein
MEAFMEGKEVIKDESRKRPPTTAADIDDNLVVKRRKTIPSTSLSSSSSAPIKQQHQQQQHQQQHANVPQARQPLPIAAVEDDDDDDEEEEDASPARIPMDRLPAPPPVINRISISPARLTQKPPSSTKKKTTTTDTFAAAAAAVDHAPTKMIREVSSVTQETEQSIEAEEASLGLQWAKLHWTRILQVCAVPIICVMATAVGWTPPFRSNNNPNSHWDPPIWPNTMESSSPAKHPSSTANHMLSGLEPEPPLTLRQVLESPFHLAMAPAFFGFYGYFGVLAAWQHALQSTTTTTTIPSSRSSFVLLQDRIQSVVGASAGAMAAVLLGAGIDPQEAANFCANLTLSHFADFPGVLAVFRGNRFEALMHQFLLQSLSNATTTAITTRLEDAILPVAVTAFDIQTMQLQILTRGSMARAARASATFPFLFQPVWWKEEFQYTDYLFLDGGLVDHAGMLGLTHTLKAKQTSNATGSPNRVINLSIGGFLTTPPPGPEVLPGNTEVISISIQRLPQPGPWAMANGKRAFEGAKVAMEKFLDVPLREVVRDGKKITSSRRNHYELHIDANTFQQLNS